MKERICCVCRQKGSVSDRIRIYREKQPDNTYIYQIDNKGNANGRGAYLCKTCIPNAIKKRTLNRSFKTNLPNEIYTELNELANSNKL